MNLHTVLAVFLFFNSPFIISDGEISHSDSGYHIESPEMRATIRDADGSILVTNFVYRGPTRQVSRLADGEYRSQFVLALRAQDICNRVYIGLNLKTSEILVQVKRNVGESTHEQCKDEGYQTIARWQAPHVEVGKTYYFAARIHNNSLAVSTEKQSHVVRLPDTAFKFNGPAGVRSDNAVVDFSYSVEDR
jgi:hypothetical protein